MFCKYLWYIYIMNIKTVTYHFIKSKDLSKTLGNKVNLTNARINDANRDYIVAIIDDKKKDNKTAINAVINVGASSLVCSKSKSNI